MIIDASNVHALARGCALFGAGGGGEPVTGLRMAIQAMARYGTVPLLDIDELPDDGLVMPICMVGAPLVFVEKLLNGDEGRRLVARVEDMTDRPVVAFMSLEIGGANGMLPVAWAAAAGLPCVDGDGMGRAYPLVFQTALNLAGVQGGSCLLIDEHGNSLVLQAVSNNWMETLLRSETTAFGGAFAASFYHMTVGEARDAIVRGSVSRAIRIGAALGSSPEDPVAALGGELAGFDLFEGKVVDVERRPSSRFVEGSIVIESQGRDAGRLLRIEMQNENLLALEDGRVLASVPDVIAVLDTRTAESIPNERIRYGDRVRVIALAADPIWRTAEGIALGGPSAFGYEFPYIPVEEIHGGGC